MEKAQKIQQFMDSHPLSNIHQTKEWGLFQSKSGVRDRYEIFTSTAPNGEIQAAALVIKQKLPLGKSWLYCPCGPLLDYTKTAAAADLFTQIKNYAKQQNAVFLRYDPRIEKNNSDHSLAPDFFTKTNSKIAHAHYQPEATLLLDLTQTEQQILAQMKPKGRYNIKVAQKHGITIISSTENPEASAKIFYELFTQTTARDQFQGHNQKYYENFLAELGPKHAKIYIAYYQNQPLAAALMAYHNQTATYYFGASSNENRHTMAPYLLHWQGILDAKNSGYTTYDFFGIAPENPPTATEPQRGAYSVARAKRVPHPWQSVTDFKLKFGGRRVEYIPAQEIIYQPFWYFAIKFTKTLKNILKHLRP